MKFTVRILMSIFSLASFFGCHRNNEAYDVSVKELQEILQKENILLIDVRTPEEIAQGKISSNAAEVNYYEADFLEKIQQQISKKQEVYIYCKGGKRSGKAVDKLRKLGYDKTYNVAGGILAWKKNKKSD